MGWAWPTPSLRRRTANRHSRCIRPGLRWSHCSTWVAPRRNVRPAECSGAQRAPLIRRPTFKKATRPSPAKRASSESISEWSGRRASNPLPRPWQGRALPSELLPLGQRKDHTLAHRAGSQIDFTGRQWVNRRPHLSRSALTLMADSCSLTRSRRPDRTAALTADTASAS
jgi:hypothetical protein